MDGEWVLDMQSYIGPLLGERLMGNMFMKQNNISMHFDVRVLFAFSSESLAVLRYDSLMPDTTLPD